MGYHWDLDGYDGGWLGAGGLDYVTSRHDTALYGLSGWISQGRDDSCEGGKVCVCVPVGSHLDIEQVNSLVVLGEDEVDDDGID